MKKIINIIVVYIFAIQFVSYAGWEGPWEVVKGDWGTGFNQFYLGSKNSTITFPQQFVVTQNSDIVIADRGNKRIAIYNSDGTIETIIEKPSDISEEDAIYGWPPDLQTCSKFKGFIISCNYERVSRGIIPLNKCIIDYNGIIQNEMKMGRVFSTKDGIFVLNNDVYYLYSPIGKLLKTYKEKPLEIGVVKEHGLGDGRYNVEVTYPENEWIIIGNGLCEEYIRVGNCNLYCKGGRQIVRYDETGIEEGRLILPEDRIKQIVRSESVEPRIDILEEYGQPIVAPNGDVYTWKYTKDNYSIIKWVWTDGHDAPILTDVSNFKDGLEISWQPPAQNDENIKGYEIVRSPDVCGPFNSIKRVVKGILQFKDKTVKKEMIYYYQVRAIKNNIYSGYSNKVVGLKK